MWLPSTCQSVVAERPSTGTQKPSTGADGIDADRDRPQRQPVPGRRAKAPAIQNSADAACQTMMRMKLRKLPASWFFKRPEHEQAAARAA